MQQGSTYGYQAIVNLPPTLSSRDFVALVQSNTEKSGLSIIKFNASGKRQVRFNAEIQPGKSFFSTTQSVKSLVDSAILQATGKLPSWSQDPCNCVVCGYNSGLFCNQTGVSAISSNPSTAASQLLANEGIGATTVASYPQPTSGILCKAASALSSAGTSISNAVNSVIPSGSTLLLGFAALLAVVFVYSFAKSR